MPTRLTLKDHLYESRLIMQRAILLLVIGGLLCLVLFSRLLYLQVVAHEHYTTLSEDNRVKLQPIPPNRGLIYDRNGILLAENLPSYRLEITPEQIGDMECHARCAGGHPRDPPQRPHALRAAAGSASRASRPSRCCST